MNSTELKRLLTKYLNGSCSDDEIEQIRIWFDSISDPSLNLTESEKTEIRQKIREKLPFHVSASAKKSKPVFSLTARLAVAASIALLAMASWFIYSNNSLDVKNKE